DEIGCTSAFCREPDKGELSWEQVAFRTLGDWLCIEIREAADAVRFCKRACLKPARDQAPFSIAFSGGGVRAAAFQAGVLWRLAEAGKMQSVEHFVAVSGGAYVASAFASSLTAETPKPQDRNEVTSFYLRCTAKTICRMQRNVSYLVRDLRQGKLWQSDDDGSSRVPPILDLPLLAIMGLFSMLINPLTAFAIYLFPFTEGIDLFEGFGMKAAFCVPARELAIPIFSIWGPSSRSLTFLTLSDHLRPFRLCFVAVLCIASLQCLEASRRRGASDCPDHAQPSGCYRSRIRDSDGDLGAFLAELGTMPVSDRFKKCSTYIRSRTVFQDGSVFFNCTCRDCPRFVHAG
ncbi:unnamed protein product, partial [Symbiodinium sp. KB8]